MNDTVDASSKHQDSLPISSDAIMEQLDNWGIAYTRADLTGVVAAINGAETGSAISGTTNNRMIPIPNPSAPMPNACSHGAFITCALPSIRAHNGIISKQASTTLAVTREMAPQVSSSTSATEKPIANNAMDNIQIVLLCMGNLEWPPRFSVAFWFNKRIQQLEFASYCPTLLLFSIVKIRLNGRF